MLNLIFLALTFLICCSSAKTAGKQSPQQNPPVLSQQPSFPSSDKEKNEQPVIVNIFVKGNKHVTEQAILNRLPYKKGDIFDAEKSNLALQLILNIGYFRQVQLEKEEVSDKKINLYVLVEEKKLLEKFTFEGNKALNRSKILEKLNLEKLPTIDEEMLSSIAHRIKNMYKEENYHLVNIVHKLILNKANTDKATAHFVIDEGPKSMIKRVFFKGNNAIADRKLRAIVFTRENWLLGFASDAGKYSPEHLEMDKHRIEYYYRDQGYLMAHVTRATPKFSDDKKDINVFFELREGPLFTVNSVKALGDDIFAQEELMPCISLEQGKPFSQSKLVDSINRLKSLWGKKGYIYADVYPHVKPDEKTRTVDITFHSERGNKMYVNRINITGNKYTRDKVIRREITLQEGDLITSTHLNESKSNIEFLSYFERGGVNWKIHRISDTLADLELNVKEAKSGNANFGLTYGSDKNSSKRSVKGMINVSKKNLLGKGWDGSMMLQANRHYFQRFQFQFINPYLFDTNTSGGANFYLRKEEYDQWKNISETPTEKTLGGDINLGFALPSIDKRLTLFVNIGIESIRNNKPTATGADAANYQAFINRIMQSGTMQWLQTDLVYDTRNSKIYPSKGARCTLSTKFTPPLTNKDFSLVKSEIEASWYSALIGEDDLVLALHAKGGMVRKLSDARRIPYKELFHMGGQGTIRGFLFGSVEPAYRGTPIGAQNMVLFNTELIFPLLPDYSMKAHFFYDAGAGWNTPKDDLLNRQSLSRDHFNLRHSIGFGINLLYPQPIKIDFGYKLDRNRELGETPYEWHISMNTAW